MVQLSPRRGHAAFYAGLLAERALWRRAPSESPLFQWKRGLVRELQAAAPWRESRAPEPLAELLPCDHDREHFLAASEGFCRPVVLRGFARDAPAVKRWSLDFLRARLGPHPCAVLLLDEQVRARDWDVPAPLVHMSFDEYFDRMTTEPLYLNSSTKVATCCPELMDDLQLERIRETFCEPGASWDELVLTNFFIGSSQVFSALHSAPAGNFFLNIAGRKRWLLTDPRHSLMLHPITKPPFQYYRSAFGGYRAWREQHDEGGPGEILWRLPRYEVVLEPGDLLYNAPWWWHEVYNLDPLTVGVAVRRVPQPLSPSPSWRNHPIFTLTSLYPAGQAVALGHYLYQRLSGDTRPLRDLINLANTKIQDRYMLTRDRT